MPETDHGIAMDRSRFCGKAAAKKLKSQGEFRRIKIP